jgi:hypothetical protein
LIFNGLHGVISQKIELFITVAVVISNHTGIKLMEMFPYLVEDNASAITDSIKLIVLQLFHEFAIALK